MLLKPYIDVEALQTFAMEEKKHFTNIKREVYCLLQINLYISFYRLASLYYKPYIEGEVVVM